MFPGFQRGKILPVILAWLTGATFSAAQPAQHASPFLPPPGAMAQPVKDNVNDYELVGMSVAGGNTFLSILRQGDQRSTWIGVGKTVGEITVLRYDPAKDLAVIRAGEKELTLTLRQARIVPASGSPQPLAVSPLLSSSALATGAFPADPAVMKMPALSPREEKEMEARMLVTDLLEIGQRQRAAYQEAHRKASAAKP